MKRNFSRIHALIIVSSIALAYPCNDMAMTTSKKSKNEELPPLKTVLEVKIVSLDTPDEVIVPDAILKGSVRANKDPIIIDDTHYYILVKLSDEAKEDVAIARRATEAICFNIDTGLIDLSAFNPLAKSKSGSVCTVD